VVAALTILRAFEVANRPKQGLAPFGSFEHWGDQIRDPLVWLSLPDPCQTREHMVVNDPVRESIQHVLGTLHDVVGEEPFTINQILNQVIQAPNYSEPLQHLREAITQVASRRGGPPNPWLLGGWFRKNVDRPVGGLKLIRHDQMRHGVQLWRVVPIDEGGEGGAGGHFPQPIIISPSNQSQHSVYLGGNGDGNNPPRPPNPPPTPKQPTDSDGNGSTGAQAPLAQISITKIRAEVATWPNGQQTEFAGWMEIAQKSGNPEEWSIRFAYQRTLERQEQQGDQRGLPGLNP
jgi:hypothetical protein